MSSSPLSFLARAQAAIAAASPAAAPDSPIPSYPWIWPPAGFQPFDTQGAIPLPGIGTGDIVVVQFTVPPGWDGVIKRLSWNVIGPGFVEGSGDIVARILANGQAIRNYDNITFELGTTAIPRSTDGILIYENQLVQLVINNSNFAAGGVQIIGSLAGYFWSK